MYTIFHSINFTSRRLVTTVESIEAARKMLERFGDVILFEVDPDGNDAADAAVLAGTDADRFSLEIYTIERSN